MLEVEISDRVVTVKAEILEVAGYDDPEKQRVIFGA